MANVTSQVQDDEIDLSAIVGTLSDKKWPIFIVTCVFFLLSVAYALLATPVYQASAMVQVEQKVPDLPGLGDLSQVLGTSNSEAVTEIALITSRSVIGKAVSNLNLQIQIKPNIFPLIGGFISRHFVPDYPGQISKAPLGMHSYAWGGEKLQIDELDVPDSLEESPLHLVADGKDMYSLFDDDGNMLLRGQQGKIASGGGARILVSALHANAGTRFEVTKFRALSVIKKLQDDVNADEQGKESGIIVLTYNNDDPDLAAGIIDQISTAYVRQNVERNAAEAANSLQFVRQQLPSVRKDLDKAQAALSAYQSKVRAVDISLQTKGLLDQEVAIETNIQQLRLQQAEMEQRFNRTYPGYRGLSDQISQLLAKKNALEESEGSLPDTQQELLRLTRDVEVSTRTYTGLLGQAQQLDIARAGTVGNVRIIDPAVVDVKKPVRPKKILVVLIATLLGAFFASGGVFLRQTLNRGVEDPSLIEEMGLPVYAAVPLSKDQRQLSVRGYRPQEGGALRMLALKNPADLAIEALRSLRTSLHFARLEAKNNILMISASSPGVGKSFVAGNLAVVIAQSGQRVLLIDADMRKGTLHRAMGVKAEEGLSEIISGQLTLGKCIKSIPSLPNLDFISHGRIPPNPSELLMHPVFAKMLLDVAEKYDLVIIDTPPILAVTDAAIAGHHAGTTLMVVRFGANQTRELTLAKQRFEQNGVEVKGAIFNAVEKRADGYYSYGYYEYAKES